LAEGINRYTPAQELNRQHAAQYEKQKPDIWTACLWASRELAAEWDGSRRAHQAMSRHGTSEKHFAFHVREGRIIINCLTATASGWKRIKKIAKDKAAEAYGHPLIVTFRDEAAAAAEAASKGGE
jgi:hypothetical protein